MNEFRKGGGKGFKGNSFGKGFEGGKSNDKGGFPKGGWYNKGEGKGKPAYGCQSWEGNDNHSQNQTGNWTLSLSKAKAGFQGPPGLMNNSFANTNRWSVLRNDENEIHFSEDEPEHKASQFHEVCNMFSGGEPKKANKMKLKLV